MTPFSPQLGERLLQRHRCGDFRLATAVSCGVHPKTLDGWLRRGIHEEGETTRFAMEFLCVESEIRSWGLREILATNSMTRQNGLIWYLERRFKQFKKDYEHRGAEGEAFDVLGDMDVAQGGLTREQKFAVIEKFVRDPSQEMEELFERCGWRKVA